MLLDNRFKKITIIGLFFLVFLVTSEGTAEEMKIHFIDVGQGDAVLLQCGEKNILIDAGPDRNSTALYLKSQNITDISLFLITGPDSSRTTGIFEVMNRTVVHEFRDFGNKTPSLPYSKVRERLRNESIPYSVLNAGDIIPINENMSITILTPGQIGKDMNDGMVLEIQTGTIRTLLLSDSKSPDIQLSEPVKIVRVADHGSRKGTSAGFMSSLRPDIAVISSGRDSKGPSEATIMSLEASGAEVFRTDIKGTIIITTDGDKYSIGSSRNGQSESISLISVIETQYPE